MRVIKFRIWDTLKKELFFEGFHVFGEVTLFDAIGCHAYETKGERSSLERYNDFLIMQFTGLRDRNGKDIYEGDICEGHSDGNGKIVWNNDFASYDYEFKDGNIVGIWEVIKDLTIIGNIHANPELL